MSLGSTSQWQAALLNYVPAIATELSASQIVIVFIGVILFCQYDYTEGTVISSLAIIEEPPDAPDAGALEKAETNASNSVDGASTVESNTTQQGQPPGLRKLARRMTTSITSQIFAVIVSYLLISVGNPEDWLTTWFPYLSFMSFLYCVRQDGILLQCNPNAITKRRVSARQYLRNQYGRWSLFRGFDAFLVHLVLSTLFVLITKPFICWESAPFSAYLLARLSLGLPLAGLQMASLHAAISKPSGKSTWQRIPGWQALVKIAPAASLDIILPTSGYYLAVQLREMLRQSFPSAIGFREFPESNPQEYPSISIALYIAPFFASFLLSVVTRAIYARVAAALLPDDEDCIVPFDRTFGSRGSSTHTPLSITWNACKAITLEGLFRYIRAITAVADIEFLCIVLLCIAALFLVFFDVFDPCSVQDYAISVVRNVFGNDID